MSQLRQHGIEDVKDVRRAFVEPDGQISVIKKTLSSEVNTQQNRKKKARV